METLETLKIGQAIKLLEVGAVNFEPYFGIIIRKGTNSITIEHHDYIEKVKFESITDFVTA